MSESLGLHGTLHVIRLVLVSPNSAGIPDKLALIVLMHSLSKVIISSTYELCKSLSAFIGYFSLTFVTRKPRGIADRSLMDTLPNSFPFRSRSSTMNAACRQCHYVFRVVSLAEGSTASFFGPWPLQHLTSCLVLEYRTFARKIDERDIASHIAASMAKKRSVSIAALSPS